MFELGLTKDAPGARWCKVWDIEKELYEYEKEVCIKYKDIFPFKLWICFRCLPQEYGRKSMRRYFKTDNALGVDISINEEVMDGKEQSIVQPNNDVLELQMKQEWAGK